MTKNKPVHIINNGTIRAAIWHNSNGFFDIVLTKSYLDDSGWCNSHHFAYYDLPTLAMTILDAHTWIQNNEKNFDSKGKLPVITENENNSGSENEEETI